jgi:hypothetical protein
MPSEAKTPAARPTQAIQDRFVGTHIASFPKRKRKGSQKTKQKLLFISRPALRAFRLTLPHTFARVGGDAFAIDIHSLRCDQFVPIWLAYL